jgi:hypothetical protein
MEANPNSEERQSTYVWDASKAAQLRIAANEEIRDPKQTIQSFQSKQPNHQKSGTHKVEECG